MNGHVERHRQIRRPRTELLRRPAATVGRLVVVSALAGTGVGVLALPGAVAVPAGCTPLTQHFAYTGGLQTFTVPTGVTELDMTVAGAAGGTGTGGLTGGTDAGVGGRGAVLTVDSVPVRAGATLTVLVGGTGGRSDGIVGGAGGGGGSFVYTEPTRAGVLVAASGGGGGGDSLAPAGDGLSASTTPSGSTPALGGRGGSDGSGGAAAATDGSGSSGGGGGLLTDGETGALGGGGGGGAVAHGAAGGAGSTVGLPVGVTAGSGGFGGGGGANEAPGDGGVVNDGGGGGGSFAVVTPASAAATNTGAGYVTLSYAAPVTVSFDPENGSAANTASVSCGATVDEPSTPTRSGYAFAGWFTAATGGTEWDFGTPVTSDLSLHAQWTRTTPITVRPNPIRFGAVPINTTATKTVSVNLAPGFTSVQIGAQTGPFTVTRPGPCTATACTLSVRYSPTLVQADSGTTQLSECNTAGCVPLTNNPLDETGSGISVFAVSPAGLDFGNQHLGTDSAPQSVTVTVDAGYQFQDRSVRWDSTFWTRHGTCSPRAGEGFVGPGTCTASWYFAPRSVGPTTQAMPVEECDDGGTCRKLMVKLSGTGTAVVTFDSRGGSRVASQTVSARVTEPTVPTRSGWAFDGWYTKPVGGTKWKFGTDSVKGDLTLYAQWTTASVEPGNVAQGGTITVTGKGFWPGEEVHAVLRSTPVGLGTHTADARGGLTFTATVPAGFAAGAHSVTLTGITSGRSAKAPLTVTAAATPASNSNGTPVLADTGADVATLLEWAVPLLAIGLCATLAGRRRRRNG